MEKYTFTMTSDPNKRKKTINIIKAPSPSRRTLLKPTGVKPKEPLKLSNSYNQGDKIPLSKQSTPMVEVELI